MTRRALGRSSAGLRARKKTRTRSAIRAHALRLFREQGYEATTMEQIAEAAEVSPSTLFRYFPTKKALVLGGGYFEPLILDALRTQPEPVDPLRAMRATFRSFFDSLSDDERANMQQALVLIASVPELRAAMLDEFAGAVNLLADAMTRRMPESDEFAVRVLAGAVIGGMMVVVLRLADDPPADAGNLFDRAIGLIETGVR